MKANRKFRYLFSVIVLAGAVVSQNAMADGYTSTATAPTIYVANTWYHTAFPISGSPSSTQHLKRVYYNWSYNGTHPSGLTVNLCNSAGTDCVDVSRVQSGSIDFSNHNLSATTQLALYARVATSGVFTTLYGGSSSVTVNYE